MNIRRHNYDYDVDPTSETAPANVVRMVGQRKRVLEIGCGPGSITKVLSQRGHCQVTAVEVDADAITRVAPYCVRVIQADLNSSDWANMLERDETFDVIVAADVLEHLYDPWNALKRLLPFLGSSGYFVISLPHVGHAAVAACLFAGNFEYRDWGLLDRTHIRFFGLGNMEDLFTQAGLKIVEARYVCKPPEETEFAARWSTLPAHVQMALSASPHAHVYQVVIKAVPRNYVGDAIKLNPQAWQHKVSSNSPSLKTRIAARLSPRTRELVRRWLSTNK